MTNESTNTTNPNTTNPAPFRFNPTTLRWEQGDGRYAIRAKQHGAGFYVIDTEAEAEQSGRSMVVRFARGEGGGYEPTESSDGVVSFSLTEAETLADGLNRADTEPEPTEPEPIQSASEPEPTGANLPTWDFDIAKAVSVPARVWVRMVDTFRNGPDAVDTETVAAAVKLGAPTFAGFCESWEIDTDTARDGHRMIWEEIVRSYIDPVGVFCDRIEVYASVAGFALPGDWRALVGSAITTRKKTRRDGSVSRFRFLAKPRKGATNRERCFQAMRQWHRGDTGGSLWGPMGWSLLDGFDAIDTLALFSLFVCGAKSSAGADRWAQALGK